jgi:hypothetical protein
MLRHNKSPEPTLFKTIAANHNTVIPSAASRRFLPPSLRRRNRLAQSRNLSPLFSTSLSLLDFFLYAHGHVPAAHRVQQSLAVIPTKRDEMKIIAPSETSVASFLVLR